MEKSLRDSLKEEHNDLIERPSLSGPKLQMEGVIDMNTFEPMNLHNALEIEIAKVQDFHVKNLDVEKIKKQILD